MKKKLLSVVMTAALLFSVLTPLSVRADAEKINLEETYFAELTSSVTALQYNFTVSSAGHLQISLTSQVTASSNILTMRLYKGNDLIHTYEFGNKGTLYNGIRLLEIPDISVSSGDYAIEFAYTGGASKPAAQISFNLRITSDKETSVSTGTSNSGDSPDSKTVSLNSEISDALSSSVSSRQYSFTLQNEGSVSIVATTPSSHNINSWLLSLYSSSNPSAKLSSLTFGGGGTTTVNNRRYVTSDKTRLPAGNYYITVAAADGASLSTVTYSLNINFTQESGGEFEKEANDTMETANIVSVNTEICGNMSSAADKDMFKIVLTDPGSLKLQFSISSAIDADAWSVYLYDANGTTLQNSAAGFGGSIVGAKRVKTLDKTRLPAGTYYAAVTAKSGSNWSNADYYLKPVYESETAARYEKEFNNSEASANPIPLNLAVAGNLSGKDDVDYFSFEITRQSEIKIEFQTSETIMQNYWTVFLQDEKGGISTNQTGLAGSIISGRRIFTSETVTAAPGKYFVVIYPINKNMYCNEDYSVMIKCDSAPIPTPSDENPSAPVNVPSRNSNVNSNISGALKNQEDVSSYDFQITRPGSVTVTFQYPLTVSRKIWLIHIYDENNNLLSNYEIGAGSSSESNYKSEKTPILRLPAGYYKLEVSSINSYSFSSVQYNFSINYTDESALEEKYEIEYNNAYGQATAIASGIPYTGNISNDRDSDYYKFSMDAGSVSLSFYTPASVKRKDWVVRLFDANLSLKYEYEFGAEGTASGDSFKAESAGKTRLPKGTYYVYVGPYNAINYSTSDYKLKVVYTAESQYKFEQEINDGFITANSLNMNEFKTGNIGGADDMDFYKFKLKENDGVQIKFRTNAKAAQGFWFVHIYDAKQTLLKKYRFGDAGSVADGMRNALSEIINLTVGEYYLAVTPFSEQTVSYEDYSVKILDKTGQTIEKISFAGDKPSSWAEEEVALAYGQGLVPNEYLINFTTPATRLEFCRLVANFLEKYQGKSMSRILSDANLTADKTVFNDTTEDVIFAINALGIVNGKGNGKFAPDDKITRQEAAAFLYRTAELLGIKMNVQPLSFKDASKFASWAKDAIPYVSGCMDGKGDRVMNGVSDATFDYAGMYTREQVYMTLLRLYRADKGE